MLDVEVTFHVTTQVASVDAPGDRVLLFFSAGRLISVKLVATSAEDARTVLTSRYGPPHDSRIAFDKSADNGRAPGAPPPKAPLDNTVHLEWSFADGGSINIDELSPRRVEVLYTAPSGTTKATTDGRETKRPQRDSWPGRTSPEVRS